MPNSYIISNWIRRNQYNNTVNIGYIQKATNVLKRVVVISKIPFSTNELNYLKFLSNSKLSPLGIDIISPYTLPLPVLLTRLYNNGYRVFITRVSSGISTTIFDWLNKHPNALIINPSSTVSATDFLNLMPFNFIRSSMPDNQMLLSFFSSLLNNLPELLLTSGNKSLYDYLSSTPKGTFPFNKIIYIYKPSLYTVDYLNNVKDTLDVLSIKVELITIPIDTDKLPTDAKFYLMSNNISNPNYVSSTEKPLIIINLDQEDIQNFMNLLDDKRYYDNFTIFADTFSSEFNTKYPFTAAFLPISNFSDRGYVLSNIVNSNQFVDPCILSVYNILVDSGNILASILNNNFNATKAINTLSKYKILSNNYFNQQYLTCSIYSGVSLENVYKSRLSIIFKKTTHDFEEIATVLNSDLRTVYPSNDLSAFDYPTNNYIQNRMLVSKANNGVNINNILDSSTNYLVYHGDSHIADYMIFLIKYYRYPLPLFMYNYFDVYRSIKLYDIPLIQLPKLNVDVYIKTADLRKKEEIEFNLQIPKIEYQTTEYYYDTDIQQYLLFLTKTFETVTYEPFTIKSVGIPVITMHLFKGHILRVGTYDEETDIFITSETYRAIAVQKIEINWLEIIKEYTIGQKIVDISASQVGTVVDISENKYYITVDLPNPNILDANNNPVIERVVKKQYEIVPLFELNI